MAIHRHQQRPEAFDAKFIEAFRIEIIHIHILHRLNPGSLQSRRTTDHGQIGTAQIAEGCKRPITQTALADDDPHALAFHQRAGEALHPVRCGGADTNGLITRMIIANAFHLAEIGRGMDHGMALQIELRAPAMIKHMNLRGIANAIERFFQSHRIAHAQRADLVFGNRHGQDVVCHVSSSGTGQRPSAASFSA